MEKYDPKRHIKFTKAIAYINRFHKVNHRLHFYPQAVIEYAGVRCIIGKRGMHRWLICPRAVIDENGKNICVVNYADIKEMIFDSINS